jgi:hypothetical protein
MIIQLQLSLPMQEQGSDTLQSVHGQVMNSFDEHVLFSCWYFSSSKTEEDSAGGWALTS